MQPLSLHTKPERAKFARSLAGLDTHQAAKRLGLTTHDLQRHESGSAPLDSSTLKLMARTYDVKLGWLTGDKPALTDPDSMLVSFRKLTLLERTKVLGTFAALGG